ncbi:hypothetical protein FHK92_08890 [Pseudomonas brassicacearum subsp. neoaurantiaca]|uniref:Uncharacterized protein n=1 Tax=Pseudomonas brassicacearum subsp. neoaurantiaca TaxID=494916 RepID=A0A7V8RK20_9PSED|nr:hypothetical protein [Pseudomonas brassicacearum subsp. neoaurantiaca]
MGSSGLYAELPVPLWRGSLLPLGCEAVVKPVNCLQVHLLNGSAAQTSGSKLPRHGIRCFLWIVVTSFGR